MPKVSAEQVEARREQILSGARRCFARWGYDGATVPRLEKEIGLSHGAIFNYYRSKLDLFVALARRSRPLPPALARGRLRRPRAPHSRRRSGVAVRVLRAPPAPAHRCRSPQEVARRAAAPALRARRVRPHAAERPRLRTRGPRRARRRADPAASAKGPRQLGRRAVARAAPRATCTGPDPCPGGSG